MDSAALRQALAAFLGDERFRTFVQQLGRPGRLLTEAVSMLRAGGAKAASVSFSS
jgi:hypothetical protein